MASSGQVPASVERQDAARGAVSSTAIGVAALRALESRKPPEDRLIYDPFAERFAKQEVVEAVFKPTSRPMDFWVDFLAVRTRWIDDRIRSEAEAAPDMQLVILGAGLDCRAYRLDSLRGKRVFEVDFPEVLEWKSALLSEGSDKVQPLALRATVGTDLSCSSDWQAALLAAGYSRERPSLWVLEGLTGYLTEEELHRLLEGISALARAGSQMLVTFVGEDMRSVDDTHMHRYYVTGESQVSGLLGPFGWRTASVVRIGGVAEVYKRAGSIPADLAYFCAEVVRDDSTISSSL